jgi:hypothetical protein
MSRDRGWHSALRQAGLAGGTSRRERIAQMRTQAREAERRQAFRYGLVALAALAVAIAAVIVAAVH